MKRASARLLLTALLCMAIVYCARAVTSTTYYLTIADSTQIVSVTNSGGSIHVTFTSPGLTAIAGSYTISRFEHLYGNTRFRHLRNIWVVTANNTLGLINQLQAAAPALFPKKDIASTAVPLYTPSDWHRWDDGYLGYIGAQRAWDFSRGDPSIVIGYSDTYIDTANPDLKTKIARIDYGLGSYSNHGTRVGGLIAGRTDNDTISFPAIGFNCRMHFMPLDFNQSISTLSELSQTYNRRIVNASWETNQSYHDSEDDAANEIYEAGTFLVAAAGNGPDTPQGVLTQSYEKIYPASYDNVFSVSAIGWKESSGRYNIKGVHEKNTGDSVNCFQHNDAVDLLAPAYNVGGLRSGAPWYANGADGTSFAAPLVAGTAGLMLSLKSCLSPYQLEYWLKQGADTTVLHSFGNLRYQGRPGFGALRADKVLDSLSFHTNRMVGLINNYDACNDSNTRTLYIRGVEISSLCAPDHATNGALPTLTAIVENGKPSYTFKWEGIGNNTTTLSSYTSGTTQINGSNYVAGLGHFAQYRLTVTDNSRIKKVAKRFFYIRLKTDQKYDLAMRDNYMDMGTEPDSMEYYNSRDWHIWESPDLWARQMADGGLEPQNPEYTTAGPNQVYVRVRNIGCASYPPATGYNVDSLQLYWPKASTGEKWTGDWDGSGFISTPAGLLSPGDLIGPALTIPTLASGQSAILGQSWTPPVPQNYEFATSQTEVCLLARIVEVDSRIPFIPYDMTIPELTGIAVSRNVRNNNNIVTRHLIVTNTLQDKRSPKHGFLLANALSAAHAYDIQIIPERFINAHFSGDMSAVAYAVLRSPALYARWLAGGGQGHGFETSATDSSFTWAGSDELLLPQIVFDSAQYMPATMQFFLRPGIDPMPFTYDIHLRQFDADETGDRSPVGAISFRLTVDDTAAPPQSPKQLAVAQARGQHYSIYPNPATDEVFVRRAQDAAGGPATVQLSDLLGRVLRSVRLGDGELRTVLHVAGLPRAEYLIQVQGADGNRESYNLILK